MLSDRADFLRRLAGAAGADCPGMLPFGGPQPLSRLEMAIPAGDRRITVILERFAEADGPRVDGVLDGWGARVHRAADGQVYRIAIIEEAIGGPR